MSIENRLALAAHQFLLSTDAAYDECAKGISTLDRIIVGTPAILAGEARGYFVPILYAYWERFFRISFGEYLRCIAVAKIPVERLKLRLAALRITREVSELSERHKFKHFNEICQNRSVEDVKLLLRALLAAIEKPAEFPQTFNWIRTYSNVEFSTLEENCSRVGIDLAALKANFPTKSLHASLKDLVDMRNDIAHGSEFQTLTSEEWEETRNFVLKLMQIVQFEIYDSLQDPARMLASHLAEPDFSI
jgi:hypothetical protein